MASQPLFNDHYKSLLDQLPPFMKKEPLSEEQTRGIRSDIEELLTKRLIDTLIKKMSED